MSGTVAQHSGRGGTAFGDALRFEFQLERVRDEKKAPPGIPAALMLEDNFTLYKLHVHKMTHAPQPKEPIWFWRHGWKFQYHAVARMTDEQKRQEAAKELDAKAQRVVTWIGQTYKLSGQRHTKNSVEGAYEVIGLGRNEVRDALVRALVLGWLEEEQLPKEERTKGKTKYLAVRYAADGGGKKSEGGEPQ